MNFTNNSMIGLASLASGLFITGCHLPDISDRPNIVLILADAAGISPSSYFTDGESFMDLLSGGKKSREKDEIFIHYSPRWGGFKHNRWVMDGEYKLYQDGNFFNTLNDPDENNPMINLSERELKIKDKFQVILTDKENEFPFSRNDNQFSPPDYSPSFF